MIVEGVADMMFVLTCAGKPTAAICHGPWMFCSAKILTGKKVTCFYSIKDDLTNAGYEHVVCRITLVYCAREILAGEKLVNLANLELFAKTFLTNVHKYVCQKCIWHMH